MSDSTPKPAFLPTTLPLPPQDVHPDELKVILAEAAARHAEAVEALAAAQDHFDAAERQREYALTEEQKRKEREEQARIQKLREMLPSILDDIPLFKRLFYAACAEDRIDLERVTDAFVEWSRRRALAGKFKQSILLYDSSQSRDDYIRWVRRIEGWHQLIRSVTSWRKGGVLKGEDDDLDGLAAVNTQINQESQDAPRPLTRDAQDMSTPYIEDLGLRDPNTAGSDLMLTQEFNQALEFNIEFSRAVQDGALRWATRVTGSISKQARLDFEAAANARAGGE